MLTTHTGRSTMKQYLPLKPVKRGFKDWVRADAGTGYFSAFDVYIGRPSDGTITEVGLGERVILQLSQSLRGGNYQIFSNNYFTTCHILDTLQSCNIMAVERLESIEEVSLSPSNTPHYSEGNTSSVNVVI